MKTVRKAGFTVKHWLISSCLMAAALSLAPPEARGDGFRCGTRLVLAGDTVARLMKACGPPDHRLKARITLNDRGHRSSTQVTQWIYERRRKRAMVVSVRGGRVVQIQRG